MDFTNCFFCEPAGLGELERKFPFGKKDGNTLVILPAWENLDEAQVRSLVEDYPTAYFVYRVTCMNVKSFDDGFVGCGILIRMILSNYKVIILPTEFEDKFFGTTWGAGIKLMPTNQVAIGYERSPQRIEVVREYERAVSSLT